MTKKEMERLFAYMNKLRASEDFKTIGGDERGIMLRASWVIQKLLAGKESRPVKK